MNIEYIKPEDDSLSKHIEYYYFMQKSNNEELNFIHFPHYRTTLNIFLNSDIKIVKGHMILNFDANCSIKTALNNNKLSAKSVSINGTCNIIGIVFKPLGINYFIQDNLNNLTKKSDFFDTKNWKDFERKMHLIYKKKSNSEKAIELNHFFRNQLRKFKSYDLQAIVNTIINKKGVITTGQLEDSFSLHRRTILRLFRKHLSCSIMDFKRTVKFRNSLDVSKKKPFSKITHLSLESNYYDQSDFINHFKSITGNTPTKVLKHINQIGQNDIFWQIYTK